LDLTRERVGHIDLLPCNQRWLLSPTKLR
jgi:hypothetical protein